MAEPVARPSIALLITDGPGLRNLALGPFLARARARFDVHVFHAVSGASLHHYADRREAAGVSWAPLVEPQDGRALRLLRGTLGYAQMFWADTGGMRYNRAAPLKGPLRGRLLGHATRVMGRMAATPARMQMLDAWYCRRGSRMPATGAYRHALQRLEPSLLLCSNQRATRALPAVLAARELQIPTATFIFSWDNVTSKGRIAAPFDHYLVWSDLMARELRQYYPAIPAERIHVVGTTQFDPGLDPATWWTRDELCARIGADPRRPILLYTGGDPGLYTAEHEYVRLLLRLVREGTIDRTVQVVVRPSPADSSGQFDSLGREFPELINVPPAWVHERPGDWSRSIPMAVDVPLLTNLVRHADVNVNLNSTMTLECALHDRPVVNIAFDLVSPPPFGMPLAEFFALFEHYRPVTALGAARAASTPAELAQQVNAYLADPALDREGRAAFAALELTAPFGAGTDRVLATLAGILDGAGPVTGEAGDEAVDSRARGPMADHRAGAALVRGLER